MNELIERLQKSAEHVRSTSKGGMEYEARLMEEAAAALEAAREDAERLDWLGSGEDRTCYVAMDDRWTVQDGPLMVGGDTLRAAIDQARGKGVVE